MSGGDDSTAWIFFFFFLRSASEAHKSLAGWNLAATAFHGESEKSHAPLCGALWDLSSFTVPGVLSPASLSLDSSLTVESASEGETLQTGNKCKHEEKEEERSH